MSDTTRDKPALLNAPHYTFGYKNKTSIRLLSLLKRVIAVWAYLEVREDNNASDSRSERGKDNSLRQDEHGTRRYEREDTLRVGRITPQASSRLWFKA